jgi:hypothetical protein
MAIFKFALEDKAAFLNRLEKAGVALDTDQIVDNKLEKTFEVTINDPKQLEAIKIILKQSPKINTIKEMETKKKKKLTKSELKEMVRQELQSVLAEKKRIKGEDEKEKIKEGIDIPATMDMIQGLLKSAEAGFIIPAAVVAALAKLANSVPGLKRALDKSTGGAPTSKSTTGKGGGMGQNA